MLMVEPLQCIKLSPGEIKIIRWAKHVRLRLL